MSVRIEKEYYDNKNIRYMKIYEDDKLKKTISFYKSGIVEYYKHYNDNYELHGDIEYFDQHGRKYMIEKYINGNLDKSIIIKDGIENKTLYYTYGFLSSTKKEYLKYKLEKIS